MTRPFLILLFTLLYFTVAAQDEVHSSTIQTMERAVNAPNTASLSRYFEVPVNMSSGVPGIQIPLYTIKSGNITLPVSLTYHAGGIKVDDIASWIGLGWSLNCGGSIVKRVNGLDDGLANVQFNYSAPWHAYYNYYAPDYSIDGDSGITSITQIIDTANTSWGISHLDYQCRFYGRIIRNQYDGESDEYFFSTPEESGSIYYNQKKGKFQLDKMNGWEVYGDGEGFGFTKNGVAYNYSGQERTVSPLYPGIRYSIDPSISYISAWYPTNFTDYINNKSVDFSYHVSPVYRTLQGQSNTIVYKGGPVSGWYYVEQNIVDKERVGFDLSVSEITFDEGKIQFVTDTAARTDAPNAPHALKAVLIFDKNNYLRKKYILDHFYASNRLFLKSVQEINYQTNAATDSRPYTFKYDTTVALPAQYSYAQDMYGYYNGKTGNTTTIPNEHEATGLGLTGFANRYIDSNYTRACMIKQIQYPTGGTINFEFETNSKTDTLAGGVRIRKITNYDSLAGKKIVTQYQYNQGQLLHRPKFFFLYTYAPPGPYSEGRVTIGDQPVHPLFANNGSPILYTEVEKIMVGDSANIKSRHYFTDYFSSGNDVPEDVSIQLQGDYFAVPYNKYANRSNYTGLEYRTQTYNYKDGSYKLQTEDEVEYAALNHFNDYIWNVQAAWGFYGSYVQWPGTDPYNFTPMNSAPNINPYKTFKELIVKPQLTSRTYDDKDHLLERVTYNEYDSENGNVRKTKSIDSNGDSLTTYYTYPTNIGLTTSMNAANLDINFLIEQYIVGFPIEIIKTRKPASGTEKVTEANLFFYDSGRLSKQMKISKELAYSSMVKAYANNTSFYYDSNYVTESEVISFNAQNQPNEISLRDKRQSIIWDGNNIIALAINASVADIAATSFENDNHAQWNYAGIPSFDSTAPTGIKTYNLSLGNVTKSSLGGSSYIVSYWSKSGAQAVNSTTPLTGNTIDGWTYYEHKVNSPGSGTITVSGSGYIDELRLYPSNAQMLTYNYKTLTGITSQCDINNRIVYYNYDGMGRLSLIKDQDKNIVKKICYNYAGQVENCNAAFVYYNVLKTQNFSRNNCGSGNTGDTLTYTVLPNTYMSYTSQGAADSLAQAEIDVKGQAYANQYGGCIYNNAYASQTFYKNNCNPGESGSPVVYQVVAGTYSSRVNQLTADNLAYADIYANGQAYANSHGYCEVCTIYTCTGDDRKCVYGICETGIRVCTDSYLIGGGNYYNTYHYEFSDGSWSANFYETSPDACF